MNIGSQFAEIMKTLKDKNQMSESREIDRGTNYNALKFSTTIDGNNYTVASYSEVNPNWKDSGPKGDYLNIISITDKDNVKIAELSATYGDNPSFLVNPKEVQLINLDKLNEIAKNLEVLPQKEKVAVIQNIQSIRNNNKPAVKNNSSLNFDWK